jgi:hypothetical protein
MRAAVPHVSPFPTAHSADGITNIQKISLGMYFGIIVNFLIKERKSQNFF